MKYIINVIFLLLISSNACAYCSFWVSTCKIKTDDYELKESIAEAFANERERAINYATRFQSSDSNDQIDVTAIFVDNGQSIDEFTQTVYNQFIKYAVVKDEQSYTFISADNMNGCNGKIVLSGTSHNFVNDNNCLYVQILKAVQNNLRQKHANKIKISKAVSQNKRDKYNACIKQYKKSSEYINYINKRDAFINRRYNNCINNGYDSMTCYSYKLSDSVGYGMEHRAPISNCKNLN